MKATKKQIENMQMQTKNVHTYTKRVLRFLVNDLCLKIFLCKTKGRGGKIMKNRVLSFMVCFCLMAGVMGGCGDSEGSGSNTDTNNVGTTQDGTSGSESGGTEQSNVSGENDNGNDLSDIEHGDAASQPAEISLLAKTTSYGTYGSIS